jgi:hypothetical protein
MRFSFLILFCIACFEARSEPSGNRIEQAKILPLPRDGILKMIVMISTYTRVAVTILTFMKS